MGQALAQMPQAMHLVVAAPSFSTTRPKGQASAHLPQPGAQLLVDHVHAGLGILGDGTGGAGLGAQTALGADHGLCSALALDDLDAGLGDVIDLVESLGASLNTLQAGHALGALLDRKLLL